MRKLRRVQRYILRAGFISSIAFIVLEVVGVLLMLQKDNISIGATDAKFNAYMKCYYVGVALKDNGIWLAVVAILLLVTVVVLKIIDHFQE